MLQESPVISYTVSFNTILYLAENGCCLKQTVLTVSHYLCETDRIFACHTGPTVWGQCLLWYKDKVKELKQFSNIPNIAKLFNYSRAFMDANKVLGGSFALMVDGQMVYKQVSLLKTSTPTSLHHISGLQARWPGSIVPQVFPLWHFSLQHIYIIWVRENPSRN